MAGGRRRLASRSGARLASHRAPARACTISAMPIPRDPNPLPAPRLRRQEAERRLREAIVSGELAPGERLTEDELAAWLGISRTPVREALGRLASIGLVELDATRGVRVAPLEPGRMLDLVQVSRQLVLLAQRLAAERATDDEILAMRGFHDARAAALRAGDRDGVERGAIGFHATILAASRNQELQRVYPAVFHRLERIFRLAYPEWLRDAGIEIDGALIAAIEAHDPATAVNVSGHGWDELETSIRSQMADEDATSAAGEATSGALGA
jgi:DNA-binding GntR family transcriptional regulator